MSDMLYSLIGADSFPVTPTAGPIRRLFHLAKNLALWVLVATTVGFGLGLGCTLGYVLAALALTN